MTFKKGHTIWLGRKHSEETKQKLSLKNTGKKHTEETKQKLSIIHTGKKASEETRKKLSEIQKSTDNSGRFRKGQKAWNEGISTPKEICKKISISRKGKGKQPKSEEHKMKLSERKIGVLNPMYGIESEMHPQWKGGRTPINHSIRNTNQYNEWRKEILNRDNYKCVLCKQKEDNPNVHHVNEFNNILLKYNITTKKDAINCRELWDINNGITLCNNCHNETKKGVPEQ